MRARIRSHHVMLLKDLAKPMPCPSHKTFTGRGPHDVSSNTLPPSIPPLLPQTIVDITIKYRNTACRERTQ
eukprot:1085389-Pyramimonas_sp.AAC.1